MKQVYIVLTISGTDWDYCDAANHVVVTLDPSLYCIHEVLIIPKTSQCQEYNIDILSKQLGSLQIIKKAPQRTIEYTNEMLTVPVSA